MFKVFKRDQFTKDYISFIKTVQEMPTKPMVMLMVPTFIFEEDHRLDYAGSIKFPGMSAWNETNIDQQLDLQ